MGREIKYGLLAVLFLIVLAAIVWDRCNLKPTKTIPSSPQPSPQEEEVIEFLIGGTVSPRTPPPQEKIRAPQQKKQNGGTSPKNTLPSAENADRSATSDSLKKYTIVSGDSLSKISKKYYGKEWMWKKLAEYNKIENPSVLPVGKVILIPLSKTAPAAPQPLPSNTYRVKRGDSLYTIAGKELGDVRKWTELAALNGIGNPKNLKTGMVIRLK